MMKIRSGSILFFIGLCEILLGFSFPHAQFAGELPEIIRLDAGMISGIRNQHTGVTAFKGIPFAAAPVGDLRWKSPQPPPSWKEVRKCDAFGPSPVQPQPTPFLMMSGEFLIPAQPMNEDCLYLNVWTAAQTAQEKRPVFVWLYGGGFITGGAAVPAYDGEALARKGLVFVSLNYRVGIFGFFSHPDLSREADYHSSGNYGLLDQLAALRWVQKNIAAFGGDPGNVTIAGQSAGSVSVNCLLASPLAKGLFHRAIAESGTLVISSGMFNLGNLAQSEKKGLQLAGALKAASLADLRKIDAHDLFRRTPGIYGPVVDGYVLPQSIPAVYAASKQNHVPLMTGWNGGEGLVFEIRKKEDFISQLKEQFGNQAPLFLKYYPSSTDAESAISQVSLSRDRMVGMPHYAWALMESKTSLSGVYVYNFTRKPPPLDPSYQKYGAFHGAEIAYALDNLSVSKRSWEPIDHQLATTISSYWVNFAATGNPNGDHLPEWPKFDDLHHQVMILREDPHAESLPNKEVLDILFAGSGK